jgi:3-polyprenyl-4-hydroxybenzoate decarboxylase
MIQKYYSDDGSLDRQDDPMAYESLAAFLEELEGEGELIRVKAEVDPILEIAEITDRISKAHGPALLFENDRGSPFPLIGLRRAVSVSDCAETAILGKHRMHLHDPSERLSYQTWRYWSSLL